MKRITLTLPDGIYDLVINNLKMFGEKDSEIIRNVLIAYIAEKGILKEKEAKNEKH